MSGLFDWLLLLLSVGPVVVALAVAVVVVVGAVDAAVAGVAGCLVCCWLVVGCLVA